jgi:hypothetical protein
MCHVRHMSSIVSCVMCHASCVSYVIDLSCGLRSGVMCHGVTVQGGTVPCGQAGHVFRCSCVKVSCVRSCGQGQVTGQVPCGHMSCVMCDVS